MTVSFIGGRNWNPRRKPPNQPQVTDKLDHIMFRVRKLIFAKQNVEQINIHYMYMYIVVYIICILSYTLNVYCRIHYMYIVGKKIDLFVQIGFTTAYVISAYHQ
jgi:hypothetical protein